MAGGQPGSPAGPNRAEGAESRFASASGARSGAARPEDDIAEVGVDLEIGPARWQELAAVARLQRRAFRRSLAYRLPTLALLRFVPGARFLVARWRGAVVGCAIGDREGGRPRVVNLAVDPDAQGQGIGRVLLAALEAALPGGDIVLMVETGNERARRLYRGAGYEEDGAAPNYYGAGRHGIWMRKRRAGG